MLILVFCGLMGIAFQSDMRQRIVLLQDFYRGILLLHQEITFLKFPLEEAACHAGQGLGSPMKDFFCETGKKLSELTEASFGSVWEEMGQTFLKHTGLKAEDLDLIFQMGQQLGRMETGESENLFKVYEQRLELALAEAREEYKEKAQLYKRLGIVGGIFLVILLL